MKIAISGGHLTPALAVIEELFSKEADLQILFLGTKHTLENEKTLSLEYKTVTQIKNVEFFSVTSGKWQRYFTLRNLLTPALVLIGFFQALGKLKKEQPQVIVVFGGYLSVPVVIAGWLLRIPIVMHEQTREVGLANKINGLLANRICLSFAESQKYFRAQKTVLTGNPLRKSIINPLPYPELSTFLKQGEKLPVIFVTGGNQGAHFINQKIREILPELLSLYQVIHQCGSSEIYQDFSALNTAVKCLDFTKQRRYLLVKQFSSELIGAVYQSSDLIISRGGINSISEILFFQKRAIVVPLPFSQKNEQWKNGKYLESVGLGKVVEQKDLVSATLLLESIKKIITQDKPLERMVESLDFRFAAEKITQETLACANAKHLKS